MSTATETPSITEDHAGMIAGLQQVLAESYHLMVKTHGFHWNVVGHNFFALHEAFEQQYTDLFGAVDEIAERLRALGERAKAGMSTYLQTSALSETGDATLSAEEMVQDLARSHATLTEHLIATRKAAQTSGDESTADLMIARTQVHQKTHWMLQSYLKER